MRRYSLMGKQRKITATKQRKMLMAIKTNGKPRVWAIKPIMARPASKEKASDIIGAAAEFICERTGDGHGNRCPEAEAKEQESELRFVDLQAFHGERNKTCPHRHRNSEAEIGETPRHNAFRHGF